MALRRIDLRKKPLLLPRPFSSSSSPNPPFPPPPPPPNSNRDDASRSPSSPAPPKPGEGHNPAATLFQDIRERLRSTPSPPSPHSIFGKELGEKTKKAKGVGKEEDSVIELKREHSYEELGKKLGQLRPSGAEKDGKEWFSLEELQGQNAKLSCHPRSCASSK
ncbi:hypothetical protein E2562_002896 [Oryza meyeriana var. granulata]|uniref:Uncharacterized protein n=1 Tax=Oryza meyeriana var. granulata TaxID=110450 RepID=A0A6G1DDE4_9ORYZ|nr:hypothetical protein E2562_002896 [Oryza meyeriana var. granulata]